MYEPQKQKDHAWRGLLLGYFSILIFSTRAFNFCPGLKVTTRRAEIGMSSPVSTYLLCLGTAVLSFRLMSGYLHQIYW